MSNKLNRKPRTLREIKCWLVGFKREVNTSVIFPRNEAELLSREILQVGGKFLAKDTTQSRHWLKWRCNCEDCSFEIAWKKVKDEALCTLVSLQAEHCSACTSNVITGSSYTYKQLAAVLQT